MFNMYAWTSMAGRLLLYSPSEDKCFKASQSALALAQLRREEPNQGYCDAVRLFKLKRQPPKLQYSCIARTVAGQLDCAAQLLRSRSGGQQLLLNLQ